MNKIISNCENNISVNPLYLIIHSATVHFKEKYGQKCLIIDSTEKYGCGIKSKIKTLNGGKESFYEKNYAKIGNNTEDNLPLNKQLKFQILVLITRRVFEKGEKLYPQIYLDQCLYELVV